MAFTKRREILFLYSVKDANPNGDPLNSNHPRFDPDTMKIMVSDVRIKRTIRDQWLRGGEAVFVDGEAKTLKTRVGELKKEFDVKTGQEALANCIDTRLFGVTFALDKESFSWTGPVQFKWGRSLHRAKAEFVQGTAAFATKETSEQRSFRSEYIVPFVLIGVYGIANQYPSKETGATDQDVDKVALGLWEGTTNLITRSKVGHLPRLLLEITYREGFSGIAGSLDEKLTLLNAKGGALSENDELAIRSAEDFIIDITRIVERVDSLKDNIETVKLVLESEIKVKGIDELTSVLGGKLLEQKR